MNDNRRITLSTNKKIVGEFTDERIIPAGGLAILGAILGRSDFIKKVNWIESQSIVHSTKIKDGEQEGDQGRE